MWFVLATLVAGDAGGLASAQLRHSNAALGKASVGKRFVKLLQRAPKSGVPPIDLADGPMIRASYAEMEGQKYDGSSQPASSTEPSGQVAIPPMPEVRRRRKRGGAGMQLNDENKDTYDEGQTKYVDFQVSKAEAGVELAKTAEDNIRKINSAVSATQSNIEENLKPKFASWADSMNQVANNVQMHSKAFLDQFHQAGVQGHTTLEGQYIANQKGLTDSEAMFTASVEQIETGIEPIYTKWSGESEKYFAPETGLMATSTNEILKQMKDWGTSQYNTVEEIKLAVLDSLKLATSMVRRMT
jgi:hypothetical protein